MDHSVKLEHVWFFYEDTPVLEDVDFVLPKNSFVGILGPNGAGKTTLVKILTGLLIPQKGTAEILGKPARAAGDRIGYVPQYSFYDMSFPVTVEEVALMGRLSRKRMLAGYSRADWQAVDRALEIVGMHGIKNKQVRELSGGQRQRVFLARALAGDPELLILDEPMSGVDICLEFEFYDLLKNLKKNMSIILISHDVGVVSHHVDNIACLNRRMFSHSSKEEALKNIDKVYGCPVDIIAHGVPHRVFGEHGHV